MTKKVLNQTIIKETWSVINREVGSKSKFFENLAVENAGEQSTNPDEISELFLHYFLK